MADGLADAGADDPSALARFGRLELVARLVVEGMAAGRHRSPFKGFSVEFAEHRQYGPGDEIRHIDWRAFGKSDRYFVKEYEEETNLRAHLVVDASGSMGYSGRTASKLEHARRLAAAIAHLMIGQRDAVGLVTGDGGEAGLVPPRSAPGHLSVLCRALEDVRAGGEVPLSGLLHALAARERRRGLVVVLSDGFEPLDPLTAALRHLRHRRHEVLFLHVLAPEEEEFPFRRPARFRGLEGPAAPLRVDPSAARAAYLERFGAFCRTLRERLGAMQADYHRASTAEDPGRTLFEYLAARSRGKSRPGMGVGVGAGAGAIGSSPSEEALPGATGCPQPVLRGPRRGARVEDNPWHPSSAHHAPQSEDPIDPAGAGTGA